ncbi:hypothetical protein LTR93_010756 [Exophiala xenobiotica]|nr:hypothetical protein LTR93_010756 [Exophiala xenobiotica]
MSRPKDHQSRKDRSIFGFESNTLPCIEDAGAILTASGQTMTSSLEWVITKERQNVNYPGHGLLITTYEGLVDPSQEFLEALGAADVLQYLPAALLQYVEAPHHYTQPAFLDRRSRRVHG